MNNNFVFMGDSLTFGYGVNKNKCWVNSLIDNTDYTIINKGVNGSTTVDMLVRFDNDVLAFNPNKVFIMGGTNDLLSNRSISFIIDNIDFMLKELSNKNITTILGIPPYIISEEACRLFIPSLTYDYCQKSLPLFREALIELSNKYNCQYVDFYSLTKFNVDKNIYIDGIHLTELGHKLLLNEFINTNINI